MIWIGRLIAPYQCIKKKGMVLGMKQQRSPNTYTPKERNLYLGAYLCGSTGSRITVIMQKGSMPAGGCGRGKKRLAVPDRRGILERPEELEGERRR